ncbi:helix-turn-helix transcriptional regulator [Phaeobacter sp. PT47_59]|uniref:helix-turn-helix domain-containing protein n=1 Tax=Phaeobacter sp. PT47_59 TaxID=3029979 RepID=UPI00238007BC|nr:helix-turn-helix transcriptional regulator [Phaeobacter sp. PT47_59]MDE4175772.1 helix-turn-helix transcriptional regulator [Phaeobacter sp. PT47_59]
MYDVRMVGPTQNLRPADGEDDDRWRKRLRQALDDRGLDYDEVSAAAGYNAEYVSKVLNGRFNPTVARVLRICEVAKIDMAYLFSGDPSADERSILEKAADLPEEDAQLVTRLIDSARAR